jgi:hypothetical protein
MEWIEHPRPGLGSGGRVQVVSYLGHAADGRYDSPHHARREPQAFRVDTPGGSAPLRTHFHTVDQFQFVAWGTGRIGGHAVAAGSVHYADAFTPYGPLRSGDRGYSYLTLRGSTDMGISYMPESRGELREALARVGGRPGGRAAQARRSLTLDLRAAEVLAGGWTRLVDEPDGLMVAVADCEAGRALGAPPVGATGGYFVVVDGTVADGAAPAGAGAVRWSPPGSAPSVTSAGDGARVALLRFPQALITPAAEPPAGARADRLARTARAGR